MSQDQKQKQRVRVKKNTRTEVIDSDIFKGTRAQRDSKAIKADLDELLDEIDAVLEENAEEFINAFVQDGGE